MTASARRKPWAAIALSVVFSVGILFLILALAGAFKEKVSPESKREGESSERKAVSTTEVRLVKIPRRESAVGTVRPTHEVNIASKIMARAAEVKLTAGQKVERGDILVRLDDADLLAKLAQVRAGEAAAKAKLDQARKNEERDEKLNASQSIPRVKYEESQTAARAAQADWERVKQTVKEAQTVLDYTVIRAPISGVVVDKKVDSGDTVSPGQTLATMYDPKNMQMIAVVPESLARRLKVGQALPARLDVLDYDCDATISEIVPEIQLESRSFQVKVVGPCPPDVYGGMYGRIFIPLEDEEVFVIPRDLARRVGQLDEVEVLMEDGSVRRRAVELGRTFEQGREVLSGLRPGEKVVVAHGPTTGTDKEVEKRP